MAARAYDRLQSDLRASSDDQIRLTTQQFSRANKRATRIVDGAIFNDNVLSLLKTILFQLRNKGLVVTGLHRGSAVGAEKPYSGDLANLLCTNSDRPCERCATDKTYEFSPPHALPRPGHGIVTA